MMVDIWSAHRKEEESMDIEGIMAMIDAYPQTSGQYDDYDYDPFAQNYDDHQNIKPLTDITTVPKTSIEDRFPAYPWDTSLEEADSKLRVTVPDGTDLRLFGRTVYKRGGYVKGVAHTFQRDVPHDL